MLRTCERLNVKINLSGRVHGGFNFEDYGTLLKTIGYYEGTIGLVIVCQRTGWYAFLL